MTTKVEIGNDVGLITAAGSKLSNGRQRPEPVNKLAVVATKTATVIIPANANQRLNRVVVRFFAFTNILDYIFWPLNTLTANFRQRK